MGEESDLAGRIIEQLRPLFNRPDLQMVILFGSQAVERFFRK